MFSIPNPAMSVLFKEAGVWDIWYSTLGNSLSLPVKFVCRPVFLTKHGCLPASLRCTGEKWCDCCAELVGLIDVTSCAPLATQFASGVPDLRLKDLACSQALLERYIIFPSPEGLYAVHEAVGTLSQLKLHAIEESMYDNIDFFKLFRLVSPLKLIS